MHADGFCTPDTICTLRWTGWTRFARPSRKVWRQLAHPTPRPGLAGPAHAGSDAAAATRAQHKIRWSKLELCARNLSITGFLPLDETAPGALAGWRRRGWEGGNPTERSALWMDITCTLGPDTLDTICTPSRTPWTQACTFGRTCNIFVRYSYPAARAVSGWDLEVGYSVCGPLQ